MHCTPNRQAVEALGEQIAEQLKEQINGIAQRLSAEGQMADSLLGWFEAEVMCTMKGVGESLLAGLCALLVERYAGPEIRCECGGRSSVPTTKRGSNADPIRRGDIETAVLPLCEVPPGSLSAG